MNTGRAQEPLEFRDHQADRRRGKGGARHCKQEDELRTADDGEPAWEPLFGRRLQPIDTQNLLCETSKYTRASNPEVPGAAGRTRIKQRFKAAGELPKPVFPEH